MDRSNYPGFEAIPDAVLVMGRDAVIVHANLHAERLFGYDPGTLIGRPAAALVPKEQRDRLARWIEEYLAKPESPPLGLAREFPALKNDGQEFPAEISLGLGGGRRIVALVRDITAALRTRERLHESERRFHIAASHAAVLVQYVDLERDLFVLFGTTDGLMGFKRDDIPTSFAAWYERMHPEDADRVRAETERIVKQGLGGWSFRYRIRGKDGSYYHWLDHGTFTEFIDGRPSAGIGVVVDETSEIKTRQTLDRMAQDLRRQDGVTRALLSSLSSHIAVLDRDGEIIVVNDAWSEFRRANDPSSLDEYVSGANYLEACRKSGASEALAGIRSVLDGSTPRFEMEFDCHTPSEKRWFSMVVTPIKTDGGGAIVTNHDVTWQVVGREEMATTMKEVERLRDQLQADTRYLMEEVRTDHDFETIIGRSSRMMATLYKVKQVARTDAAVLLLGETGTGKELLARAIHARSSRSGRPLVKVDCATLPPGLIESELFGHEKGAFTGAERAKPGRFELADGATVFLDEIGELPVELQPKLLRVLEEGESAARRCPGHRGDQPGPEPGDARGPVSFGPVLPNRRLSDRDPASARPSRRHPVIGIVLHHALEQGSRQKRRVDSAGRHGCTAVLRLAGKHPGAAERARTVAHPDLGPRAPTGGESGQGRVIATWRGRAPQAGSQGSRAHADTRGSSGEQLENQGQGQCREPPRPEAQHPALTHESPGHRATALSGFESARPVHPYSERKGHPAEHVDLEPTPGLHGCLRSEQPKTPEKSRWTRDSFPRPEPNHFL
jgi:PAS domain S-box-containing protein